MSSVYRKSQKHEARKYVGISWNSNLKLPCENKCDLVQGYEKMNVIAIQTVNHYDEINA